MKAKVKSRLFNSYLLSAVFFLIFKSTYPEKKKPMGEMICLQNFNTVAWFSACVVANSLTVASSSDSQQIQHKIPPGA